MMLMKAVEDTLLSRLACFDYHRRARKHVCNGSSFVLAAQGQRGYSPAIRVSQEGSRTGEVQVGSI